VEINELFFYRLEERDVGFVVFQVRELSVRLASTTKESNFFTVIKGAGVFYGESGSTALIWRHEICLQEIFGVG
jgi:hypothetical protein